jgi:hypothetical protein
MKMDKHLKKIRNSVLEFQRAIEGREELELKLKQKFSAGDIAPNERNAQLARLKETTEEAYRQSILDIGEVVDEYQTDLDVWATLKGEELTDDVKLLNSPISLSSEDYEDLEVKYQNNYSMLKAIQSHAAKNDVNYSHLYIVDKKEKLTEFQKFADAARNVINSTHQQGRTGYTGALWAGEEHFEKMHSDTARRVQLGKEKKSYINYKGETVWE